MDGLGVDRKVTDPYRIILGVLRQALPLHPQTRAIALKDVLSSES